MNLVQDSWVDLRSGSISRSRFRLWIPLWSKINSSKLDLHIIGLHISRWTSKHRSILEAGDKNGFRCLESGSRRLDSNRVGIARIAAPRGRMRSRIDEKLSPQGDKSVSVTDLLKIRSGHLRFLKMDEISTKLDGRRQSARSSDVTKPSHLVT